MMTQHKLRWYKRKSVVDFEEDEYNEFKGHRNLAVEELPPWCFLRCPESRSDRHSARRSRKAASRAINAFLNSGRSGIVYLGIVDDGVVKGLYLTEYQKDHLIVSLKDLFSRYVPVVNEDKYEVSFVPVYGKDEEKIDHTTQPDIEELCLDKHLQPHLLRTFDYCWCDRDFGERLDKDEIVQAYVVEIRILPQKAGFEVNEDGAFKVQLPSIHENEEGQCYFRKSASCVEYSLENVRELTIQQVSDMYEPVIERLQEELRDMVEKLEERAREHQK